MKLQQCGRMMFISMLAVVLLLSGVQVSANQWVAVQIGSSSVSWNPQISYERATLRLSAPDGTVVEKEFTDSVISVAASTLPGDGEYSWELTLTPELDEKARAAMKTARESGDATRLERLRAEGVLPPLDAVKSSGYLRIAGGAFATGVKAEEPPQVFPQKSEPVDDRDPGTRDVVYADDLIVDGSACIGFDCVNGESFGFDTLRLKENNLRIKFDDTSSSASFPNNDWQLTANDSANGGANKFSIDDISGGRTPFTIEASAPSHSLYVDDGGRVGFGTSTPVVDLHVKSGNTPTLRLDQDGSSGFAPQVWDVAGNETNFFIRDASNGSTLPFRIFPSAASNSLLIGANNNVGMGTSTSPSAALHVKRTDGTSKLYVEEAIGTSGQRDLLELANNGGPRMVWRDTGADAFWRVSVESSANRFVVTRSGTGAAEMELDNNGNLSVRGSISSSGTTLNVPDYVFESGYDLMAMDELANFLDANGHLPDVPSAAEIKQNGLKHDEFQMALLKKIEELTLYTLAQQENIEKLQLEIANLRQTSEQD